MTDKLIAPKATDGFTTESPIRAFTDFKVNGRYAIGKGFRPSMAHLGAYLDAMEGREGWKLVQVIMPDNEAGDPTMLFNRVSRVVYSQACLPPIEDIGREMLREAKTTDRKTGKAPELGMPYGDDPIHPKHYDGTACCEIIDHMPANVGLATKYIWRLGEKDPIAQEIGKLIFYLERQIEIEDARGGPWTASFGFESMQASGRYLRHSRDLVNARVADGTPHAVYRATALHALVNYTVTGKRNLLVNAIEEMRLILLADGITTGLAT